MRIVRHLEGATLDLASPVVTLGNFDGVHLGHQAILDRVVAEARDRGGAAVAITFFPHPARVLAPGRVPVPIASLRDRFESFREAGIDVVVAQRFTRAFSELEPEAFVERMLVSELGAVKVVVGHSVSFGHKRRGTADLLRDQGERHGFAVEIVGPVLAGGIEVSSTKVRGAVVEADLALATQLLGRPYALEGRVVLGARRGRTIGFPTANLRSRVPPLVPDGVYAVRAEVGGAIVGGAANVGRNPTFGPGAPRTVETHLLDFDRDVYGEKLRVEFVERIRGEIRFGSVAALVDQIAKDVARAREILLAPSA